MNQFRKTQSELDKLYKKIGDQIDIFDSTYAKVYSTTNHTQKEKFEADLKKEIKKLQRSREVVRGYLSNDEIRDKTQLMEYRSAIEKKMEEFRKCEREIKIKEFSNFGLAKTKDGSEKIAEATYILESYITKLNDQITQLDSELENNKFKKKKFIIFSEKINKHKNNHRFIIQQLEDIIMYLDDKKLQPDVINNFKDDIEEYIEHYRDDEYAFDEECFSDTLLTISSSPYESSSSSPIKIISSDAILKEQNVNSASSSQSIIGTPTKQPDESLNNLTSKSSPITQSSTSLTSQNNKNNKKANKQNNKNKILNSNSMSSLPITPISPAQQSIQKINSVSNNNRINTSNGCSLSRLNTNSIKENLNINSSSPDLTLIHNNQPSLNIQPVNIQTFRIKTAWEKDIQDDFVPYPDPIYPSYESSLKSLQKSKELCPVPKDSKTNLPYTILRPYNCKISCLLFQPEIIESERLSKIKNDDAFFYSFYFQPNTYQQYLASRKLKERNWRYYQKLSSWFRPASSAVVEGNMEKGMYEFFDYEQYWNIKPKQNHSLNINFIENELL